MFAWSNIKLYIYGAVTFLIGALGVWVKILSEQKKTLKKDVEKKDRQIEQVNERVEEVQEAREQEDIQHQIDSKSEVEKDNVSSEIESKLKESLVHDVKVTL